MVDETTKKVEDTDDDSSELDFSIKTKSNKINILGQSLDWATLLALGLGVAGTIGAGYLIYNEHNKNKALDDQRKYEQWILQQQATMMNQPPQAQPPSHIPPPATGNDMVDMNSISAGNNVNYDKFLERGLPSGGSRLVQSDRPIPPPQGQVNTPMEDEPIVDMDSYNGEMSSVPVQQPRPVKKEVDPTTEELMNAMNQYEYGS